MSALEEFDDALERARVDLESRIAAIVGGLAPFLLFEEQEDGTRRINKNMLLGLLDDIDVAPGEVEEAFEDFAWTWRRELRALKRALRQEATP